MQEKVSNVSRPLGEFTRRRFLSGAGGLLLLGAVGCGGGAGGSSGDSSSGDTRTIEHKFGTTEITGTPERVVSVGFSEHDFVYALGVRPVGVRYWYGDEATVIKPWAEEAAGGVQPEVLNMVDGLNFEAIAALNPDLIVGVSSGMSADDYETLAEIAPTVTQTDEYIDYGTPWPEMTMIIGRALGKEQLAQDLVAEVEARFEDAVSANPQFAGQSLAVSTYDGTSDTFGTFAEEDPRSRFFSRLGFETPEEFTELAGDSFYTDLSAERVDLLDTDVLVWDQISFTEGGRETIETAPLIEQLDVMRENRAVFLEGETEEAFGWQTILSIPFALEAIVPMLEEVTAGSGAEETTA